MASFLKLNSKCFLPNFHNLLNIQGLQEDKFIFEISKLIQGFLHEMLAYCMLKYLCKNELKSNRLFHVNQTSVVKYKQRSRPVNSNINYNLFKQIIASL